MKKILFILSLLLSGSVVGNFSVQAEDTQPMGGYSIEGIPNAHQLDKKASYFYLYEQPSEEDQIQVKLENSSSEEKRLSVKVIDGNTNIKGDIDYTGTLKNHASLSHPLTSILKPEQSQVTVPAHSTIETVLNIKMPIEKFSGIVLGAIQVSEAKDKTDIKGMTNTYSYTLGVVLTNTDKIELNKNISVKLDNVSAQLFEGKKVVEADILNNGPYIFSKANISGEIKEKASGKIIQKASQSNVSIAPNSIFPFQFDWKKENLKPGTYIFTGKVKDDTHVWKLEKEFIITSEQTKKINKNSVFKIFIPLWIKIVEGISIILIIILIYCNSKILKGIR